MVPGEVAHTLRSLTAGAAGLAAAAAAAGILWPGLYRPITPEQLVPGALGQDTVTLIAAALLFTIRRRLPTRRAQDWLIWAGLMGYLAYGYALYSFDGLTNPLFLVYIAVFACALWALILFLRHARPGHLFRNGDQRPPRRITAFLFLALAGLFFLLWMTILVPAMAHRAPPDGVPIFVMDLSLMLPLLVLCAVALLNARPLGDVLAPPLLVKMATLGISVLLGTLYAPFFDRPLAPGEIATYAFLGLGPLALIPPWLSALNARA